MIREGIVISGRYEIVGRIGTGGMADVYKAMDLKLNRYVAVKVLKREFREDAMFVQKFHTEAQSVAGLSDPNIVNVFDVGEDRGLHYIVMELVEGITLKDYIQKKGKLTPKEVISIAVQVCSGIEAAHSNNIVHRDIKPQNIMISKEGKVKVTDFGIAKATSSNTISTNAMGSVHYTSPEQARGGFSDAKSDIYSLGITMYEMITGELPFDGDSTVSIALKHLQEDMVPPSEIVADIPYSLEQIILKCTQKSPDRRYASIGQLQRDLRRAASDPEGDFVEMAPLSNVGATRMITPEEMSHIKNGREESRYEEDDEYDVYDDYEEERRRRRRKSSNNNQIDPKMSKVMRMLTIVVIVIFAFILLFFGAKAIGIFGGNDNPNITEKEEILVPNLVGMTKEEAEMACEERGLVLVIADEIESEKYEEGIIDSQKTQPDTEVPKGAKVQVVISIGLKGEEIEIPDVRNKTREDAIQTLVDAGFKEANIGFSEREDDEIEANRACGTTPEVGSMATEKSEITIVISKGAPKVFVPKLVGKTKEEAHQALKDAGLEGNPIEEYSTVEAGKVIEQETKSGESVEKGTVINYTVSKGEKTVIIPTDLVGKSASSVKATLSNLELKVSESYSVSDEFNEGYVMSVIGAGTTVKPNATVQIIISTGPGPNAGGDNTEGGNTTETTP